MKECSPEEIKQIKSAIAQIEPIAEKSGMSVADLVEKYSGSEVESEEEGEDPKVAMIVAKMKSKNDYEG